MDRVDLVAVIAAFGLVVVVVELVRRRSLREEYALLWLLMGAMLLVLSLWRQLLHGLAALIGIYYPPSALFLVGFGLVLLILLHFSTVVSVLTRENKTLAQQLALLAWRVEQVEKVGSEAGTSGAESGCEAGHDQA